MLIAAETVTTGPRGGRRPSRTASVTALHCIMDMEASGPYRTAAAGQARRRCWMKLSASSPGSDQQEDHDMAIREVEVALPVSSTVAVVSTRVEPRYYRPASWRRPPRRSRRQSRHPAASIGAALLEQHPQHLRVARREPQHLQPNASGTCCTAAMVSPVTIGTAITNWPATIATGCRAARGSRARRCAKQDGHEQATTTGGSPMPVFTRLTARARPGKRASASSAPSGMPTRRDRRSAPPRPGSDSQVICQTSDHPPAADGTLRETPCPKSPSWKRAD